MLLCESKLLDEPLDELKAARNASEAKCVYKMRRHHLVSELP